MSNQPIALNREIKTPLTPEMWDKMLNEASEAYDIIGAKAFEIEEHKEAMKALKDEIDAQHDVVKEIMDAYKKGYISKTIECYAKYEDGEVTFTNAKTGEIVEQRPMNEDEQLQLPKHIRDAEAFIREVNKQEDNKESEEE